MIERTREEVRVAATRRLLRSAPREALGVVTDVAGRLLRTTSAEVALVTDVRHTVVAAGEATARVGTTTERAASLCDLVVRGSTPLTVPDAVHDGRVRDLAVVRTGVLGSYLGVPLVADDGTVVGSLCVHQHDARAWTPHDTDVLAELAHVATGHLEVAALTEEYRGAQRAAALEGAARAAGIGTWDWNLADGSLVWDDVLLDLFGLTAATFGGTVDSFFSAVHPDDLAHVSEAVDLCVREARTFEAEFRVLRPDSATRWVVSRGKPLTGPDGSVARLIGAVTDLTAVHEGEARLGAVLDTMAVGYLTLDHAWRYTHVNSEAERILGHPRADLLGRTVWDLFPALVGTETERRLRHVARTGEEAAFDTHFPTPLHGSYENRVVPLPDGLGVYLLDITERVAAQRLSERNRERAETLARVASAFTETADAETALVEAARSLVPRHGDWVIASVLDEGQGDWRGRLRDVGAAHRDPGLAGLLEEYRAVRAGAWTEHSAARTALFEGTVTRLTHTRPPDPRGQLAPGRAHDLLTGLAPASTLVLPLRGRGRTRGLLTLVRGAQRPAFTDDDVTELAELTRQIGLGLDNGRLYAEQRGLAEELQLSLLADLPEPDHLHLVARYVAATDGAQIGGDWYDGFVLRDGSTCLVVGDVTGHDRGAAVAMAQVRNVLRGVAHAVGDSPARILRALDRAVHDLAVGTLGTAVLATVEPGPPGTAGPRVLRWSSAGHLPPLLLHADGRAELLDREHDVMLGLNTGFDRHDHTAGLEAGDTVLFYTDGLVERRGEDLDVGLERLRRHAADLVGSTPDALCEALVERLADGREDDVALLVLRVLPADRPRPPGAGPERLPGDLDPLLP
ncbi:SpoIIE family protein phosphatase [Kineococcus sp. SYSU DK001]|uniref:SpoIIE family protein phosphatase n=1 Tax=Kineococcus sp. SYSU DK001 TaxID=3383122 RepID=UPI003D7E75D5